MNCFTCRRSEWMQKKSFEFLGNFLNNYNDVIRDDDVFSLLKCDGAEENLEKVVRRTFPKTIIDKMSSKRHNDFLLELDTDPIETSLSGLWNYKETRGYVRKIMPSLIEYALKESWSEGNGADVFHEKMLELQRTLKLSDLEIDILLVALGLEDHIIDSPGHPTDVIMMMSKCLNANESVIVDNVEPNKPLRRFQCIDGDLEFNGRLYGFLNGMTNEPLASIYFRKDAEKTLPWSDFGDLAKKHGEILKRMLTNGDKPVSILLYGAPGTGKTSFARALSAEIGRITYCVSQGTSSRGNENVSTPEFRFGALQVCDSQVSPKDSLIVVDEADDMLWGFGGFPMRFGGFSTRTGDKGMLNTVLDTMKTSSIWITNTPASALDESSRRRFDYSIRFEPLNCEQRKRIWKNNVNRLKLGKTIGEQQIEEFSALYPVSAGGISQTLENLEMMHPKKSEVPRIVEQLMKPHCELLEIKLTDDKLLPSKDYSLEGLNIQGDVKLERIVSAIRSFQKEKGKNDPDRPRMNLLLSGAPGTGKTEFVKYLGDVLKTKVNVKMGSDLLSMWVGGTEQNIANAFRQAEAERAILFLDEIDGLVQSRTNAQRSWEVTQVNELLHQMENFDGVMIGATNFIQNLDQAIMRRFTFKLQFDYLDNEGKRLFFERMFKTTLDADDFARLKAIPNLAPGDFRTVRQSLFYYGGEITNTQRLDALMRESAAKEGGAFAARGRIGF